jgi:L,D-transpeptidase catalytic domain
MAERRSALLLSGMLLALAACSGAAGAGDREVAVSAATGIDASDSAPEPSTTRGTDAPLTSTTVPVATSPDAATTSSTVAPSSSTTTSTSSTTSTTSSTSTTTTTTTVPPLPVHDPACVVVVEPGDSLSLIAERIDDEAATVTNLQGENFLGDSDVIHPGEYLDVCVDNDVDDVTGEQRPNPAIVQAERRGSVEVQQQKLNELFASLGSPELLVDGISGPLTRQMLCAARLGLGLPTSTADMEAGSEEEATLLAAERIVVPWNEAVRADRWALVDRTCQIMFVGQGTEQVTFVFPVSTGAAEHETDLQTRARAFRYDPAVENGGWHNSTTYPVPADNALNGNMYRPIYFNNGEAIHGASVVPPYPRSKGCVRLHVQHQDALVSWLGLADAGAPIWRAGTIDLAVTVQGDYTG